MVGNGMAVLPHPPYSLDMALSDFFISTNVEEPKGELFRRCDGGLRSSNKTFL